MKKIENIHNSLINGQRKQAVKQIDDYGKYDFWEDYEKFLDDTYANRAVSCGHFMELTISYFRIKNR